eukprot:gnl/TRDRNA2_/TRDRNA2_165282_c3_seq2.p1 gnl/TRDRNA2_/TRDRNA2_165282_c3~~gnl/TRDRNA2_/TRDRNA2_165282_c3_seq2.p1  ORF type:complete len:738 (+),score=152.09 gnl/TRDRNA2_/TRDRNA2_165282_c3_seq2:93-2306(+)
MGMHRPAAAVLLTIFCVSATTSAVECDADLTVSGESNECLGQPPTETLHLLQRKATVLRSGASELGQGTAADNMSLEAAVNVTAETAGSGAGTDMHLADAHKLQAPEKEEEEDKKTEAKEKDGDDDAALSESHAAKEEDEKTEANKKDEEEEDTEEDDAKEAKNSESATEDSDAHDEKIAAEAAAEAAEEAAGSAVTDDMQAAADVIETHAQATDAAVSDKAAGVKKSDAPRNAAPPIALSGSIFGMVVCLCLGATAIGYYQGPETQAMLAPYICEFLGTFLLVFTVGCVVLTGSGIWNATAIAAILMVAIYAVGPISGGHLNPAVTLALLLTSKEESGRKAAIYMSVQVLGGVSAGCLFSTLFGKSVPLGPSAGFGWSDVMIVEVLYTAMLCFVVLNVAASKRNNPTSNPNQFFALAIGFVIIAGGYGGGPVSGGAFNPAVALGLDISSYNDGAPWALAYTVYECLGAALGALCFYGCRPEDFSQAPAAQSMLQTIPEDGPTPLRSKALSEFVGTFYLVFTVGMNLSMGSTATAWSAAAALMCMIYSLGDVSGANFNPAVTVSILLSGREKLPLTDGLVYIGMQLVAGASAGLLWCHFHMLGPNSNTSITLGPHGAFQWSQIAVAEVTFTFVLAYTVLCVATTAGAGSGLTRFYFALAIGSCVTAGGFAVGSVSGGELNPAVSLGIAAAGVVDPGPTPSPTPFGSFFLIAVLELLGGALASCMFRLTHVEEYNQVK